ncbi:MAG: D-alanyl-D-alanine carboxypeptidase [Parachlamydiaceae bacterium]|nr:D-alanyl-D-alanine carboxypeptidase [Parachlamydiaceae bacterium]
MMRRLLLIALSYLLIETYLPLSAFAETLDLSVNAEAAILMNADTGAILYEKNSRNLYFPASITKIATAIYTLQKKGDDLDVKITAEQDILGSVTEDVKRKSNYSTPSYILVNGGTHIGIKKGEVLSLRNLLYGMMLASGNDASNVIAHYVGGGSIPQFIQELNVYLKKIGCLSTTFQNPHGLYHPKHETTAYDMAILTGEALKNPQFRQIVSTVRYTRPKTNKQEASTLVQSNLLLRPGKLFYPKAIGVKTGHLALARNTFVGAAKDGNRTLIAVLLKVQDRKDMFTDAVKMFEMAFSQPKIQRVLLKSGPQKFSLQLPGAKQLVATYLKENATLEYYPAEEPKVKCLLTWENALILPIEKGTIVAHLSVQLEDGQVLKQIPLNALETVDATFWYNLKSFFSGISGKSAYLKVFGSIIIVLFLGFFAMQLRRKGS